MNRICILILCLAAAAATAQTAPPTPPTPAPVALVVDGAALLDALKSVPPAQQTMAYHMILGTLQAIQFSQLRMLWFSDAASGLSAAAFIEGDTARLDNVVSPAGPFAGMIVPDDSGNYRLSPPLRQMIGNALAADALRLRRLDEVMVVTTADLLRTWTAAGKAPLQQPVFEAMKSLLPPGTIAALGVVIPETFSPHYAEALIDAAASHGSAAATEIVRSIGPLLSSLPRICKQVRVMALGCSLGEDARRQVALHLRAESADGAATLRATVELLAGPQGLAAGFYNELGISSTTTCSGDVLALQLSWPPAADGGIQRRLMAYAASLSGAADEPEGEVPTRLRTCPEIVEHLADPEAVLDQIVETLPARFFPVELVRQNQVPVRFDELVSPNALATRLTYRIISVSSATVEDAVDAQGELRGAGSGPELLWLPLTEGVTRTTLRRAKLEVTIALPAETVTANLQLPLTPGTVIDLGDAQATVTRAGASSVVLRQPPGLTLRLLARDDNGHCLRAGQSELAGDELKQPFHGRIRSLQVILGRRFVERTCTIEIDVAGGKARQLPARPDTEVRTRYLHQPLLKPEPIAASDLDSATVDFLQNRRGLQLVLPADASAADIAWDAAFFDAHGELDLRPRPATKGRLATCEISARDAERVVAAFGRVRVRMPMQLQRVELRRDTVSTALDAAWDRNQVRLRPGKHQVLQLAGFDAAGRRLVAEAVPGNVYRFWGQPATLTIDLATAMAERIIEFDLRRGKIDPIAFAGFKLEQLQRREVLSSLRLIGTALAAADFLYNDDVAGLYYVQDADGNPLVRVPLAVAQADPTGATRFGYKPAPFNGYFFMTMEGELGARDLLPFPRREELRQYTGSAGGFALRPYSEPPDVLAYPADLDGPAFLLREGSIQQVEISGKPERYAGSDGRLLSDLAGR